MIGGFAFGSCPELQAFGLIILLLAALSSLPLPLLALGLSLLASSALLGACLLALPQRLLQILKLLGRKVLQFLALQPFFKAVQLLRGFVQGLLRALLIFILCFTPVPMRIVTLR